MSDMRKSPAQLDREIREALARPRGKAKPSRFHAEIAKPRSRRGSSPGTMMTPAEFLASLPPPIPSEGPYVPLSTIVKTVRSELKQAIEAGALPAGTKVSVRTDHNSIYVAISGWAGNPFSREYTEHLMDPSGTPWEPGTRGYGLHEDPSYTPELNAALQLIEKIAGRHNWREHDPYADYGGRSRYYLTVDARGVEGAARTGIEMEANKGFSDLMVRGQEAARAVGPAATKSICGTPNLSRASEWCLKQLIRVAERAAGRPVQYDKSRRGWFPAEG